MFVSINVWSKFSYGWADIKKIWKRKLRKEKKIFKRTQKAYWSKATIIIINILDFSVKTINIKLITEN